MYRFFLYFIYSASALNIDEGSMEGYLDLVEVYSFLEDLSLAYPLLVSQISLGRTANLYSLKGLKISTPGLSQSKGIMVVSASQISGFPISTTAALYFASTLLSLGPSPYLDYLLATRDIYVFPILNPDAYAWTEIHYTQTKQFSPFFTNRNRTNCMYLGNNGVRLNRNWGFQWNTTGVSSPDPCDDTYPGTESFSEIETYSLEKIFEDKNITTWLHYEGIGNQYIKPFTYLEKSQDLSDSANFFYSNLGNFVERNWTFGTSKKVLGYIEDGSLIDWWANKGSFSLQVGVGEVLVGKEEIIETVAPHFEIAAMVLETSGFYLYMGKNIWTGVLCNGKCADPEFAFEIIADFYIHNSGSLGASNLTLAFDVNYAAFTGDLLVMKCQVDYSNWYNLEPVVELLENSQSIGKKFKSEQFEIPKLATAKVKFFIYGKNITDSVNLIGNLTLEYQDFENFAVEISEAHEVDLVKPTSGSKMFKYLLPVMLAVFVLVLFSVITGIWICRRKKILKAREIEMSNYKEVNPQV